MDSCRWNQNVESCNVAVASSWRAALRNLAQNACSCGSSSSPIMAFIYTCNMYDPSSHANLRTLNMFMCISNDKPLISWYKYTVLQHCSTNTCIGSQDCCKPPRTVVHPFLRQKLQCTGVHCTVPGLVLLVPGTGTRTFLIYPGNGAHKNGGSFIGLRYCSFRGLEGHSGG